MLDGVRLVVAQADYRVGDVGVQVRASDDAEPGDGPLRSGPLPRGRERARLLIPRAIARDRHLRVVVHDDRAARRWRRPGSRSSRRSTAIRRSAPSAAGDPPRARPARAARRRAGNRRRPPRRRRSALHRLYVLDGRSARAQRMQAALVAAAPVAISSRSRGASRRPATAAGACGRSSRGCARRAPTRSGSARAPGPASSRCCARSRPGLTRVRSRAAAARRARQRCALPARGCCGPPGAAAEGIHLTSGFVPPDALSGAGADFVDAFARQFGEPGLYTAYAADAARLVLAALRRSDATPGRRAAGALPHALVPGPDREGRDRRRRHARRSRASASSRCATAASGSSARSTSKPAR